MTEEYRIDRSRQCHVFKNATDKPLSLSMHHYHARSLLVNLDTGDVLSYLFANGSFRTAMEDFNASALDNMLHTVFLAQEGRKALIFLMSNHTNIPSVGEYVSRMTDRGAYFCGITEVDIMRDYQNYALHMHGEIPMTFTLDLSQPDKLIVQYADTVVEKPFSAFPAALNKKSTLPDISELEQNYFKYVNIGRMIAWADERLPNQLENRGIDLSDLSEINGVLGDALESTMEKEKPFSTGYLYQKEHIERIPETLMLLKEKGLAAVSLAGLCGAAASETARQLMRMETTDPDFFYVVALAQTIIPFAAKLITEQPHEIGKCDCNMQMQGELTRLQQVIAHKMMNADFTLLPQKRVGILENLSYQS